MRLTELPAARTGTAPAWVSATLHIVLPVVAAIDWLLAPDRGPLSWRRLWIVVAFPLLWVSVVLVRGATDGWVPYGFLLPERGLLSLTMHLAGLLCTVIAAGSLVWATSCITLATSRLSRQ